MIIPFLKNKNNMIHGEYSGTSNTKLLLHLNGNSVNSIGSVTSTETNLTYVPGKFDQCANFNQTNSSITYADIGTLATFTISLWINTTSISNCILCQSGQYVNGFFFQINDVGKIDFEIWNGGASTHIYSTVPINDGNWHNIIVTRSSATVNIYIDGNFNNQSTTMYTFTIENYYRSINKKLSGYSSFNGKLDEIIIENIVWSSQKISYYYDYSFAKRQSFAEFITTPNTKFYFPLNGNSINYADNIILSDNNMTYVNGKFNKCASYAGGSFSHSYSTINKVFSNYTASFWINTTTTANSTFFNASPINSSDYQNGTKTSLELGIDQNQKFAYTQFDGSVARQIKSSININTGKWIHIVITKNNGVGKIYLNGEINNINESMFNLPVNAMQVTIGAHTNTNVAPFNGNVEEIIIEDVVWSAEKVKKYYTNSIGRYAIL